MPKKRRRLRESFNRQAMPRSDSMPSKYPIISDPEIDPRRQARTTHLLGVKPGTQLLYKRVESCPVKNLVQTNIERVTGAHSHIRIRHPQILLPLSILACSHRHDLILRMTLVDTA